MSSQKTLGFIIALIGSLVALLAFFVIPYLLFATGVQIGTAAFQAIQYSSSYSPGYNPSIWFLLIWLLPLVAVITTLIAGMQMSWGTRAGRTGAGWLIVLGWLTIVGMLGVFIYFAANNASVALGTGYWVNLVAMIAVLVGGIVARRAPSPAVSQPWTQPQPWASPQQPWQPMQPPPQGQPWQQSQQQWPPRQSSQQWPPSQTPQPPSQSSPQWPPTHSGQQWPPTQRPQSSPQWPPTQQPPRQ